jgi:hypothetical protein
VESNRKDGVMDSLEEGKEGGKEVRERYREYKKKEVR